MTRHLGLVLLASVLVAALAACGTTPEPTRPPATQTPWIIVVTATPAGETLAEAPPTQTPWIIIATPTPGRATALPATETATSSQQSSGGAEETAVAPTATLAPSRTPAAAELKYPPPALLEPPNDRPVSWKSTVLLEWESVGRLASDEYYHLHLERRPSTALEPWYGDYVFTKDSRYLLSQAFLDPFHPSAEHGSGVVYWWVRVVRKTGEGQDGKPVGVDISPSSEERTLILDPKPRDS
jgi:hypothetical protein